MIRHLALAALLLSTSPAYAGPEIGMQSAYMIMCPVETYGPYRSSVRMLAEEVFSLCGTHPPVGRKIGAAALSSILQTIRQSYPAEEWRWDAGKPWSCINPDLDEALTCFRHIAYGAHPKAASVGTRALFSIEMRNDDYLYFGDDGVWRRR